MFTEFRTGDTFRPLADSIQYATSVEFICGIHGGCSLEETARSGRVVVCTYWLSTVVRRPSNFRFSRQPRTQARGKGSPGHALYSPAKSAEWADPPWGSPFAMPRGES